MKHNFFIACLILSFVSFSCQKKSEDKPVLPPAPRFVSASAAIEYLDSVVYGMKACVSKLNELKVGAELKDYKIELSCNLTSYYPTINALTDIVESSSEVLATGLTLSQKNYVNALVTVVESTLINLRAAHDMALSSIDSIASLQSYLASNGYKTRISLRLNPNDYQDKNTVPARSDLLLVLEAIEGAGSYALNDSILDEILVVEKTNWDIEKSDFEHTFQSMSDYAAKKSSSKMISSSESYSSAVFSVSTRMLQTRLQEVVTQLSVLPRRKDSLLLSQATEIMKKLNISTLSIDEETPQKIAQISDVLKKLDSIPAKFKARTFLSVSHENRNQVFESKDVLFITVFERASKDELKAFFVTNKILL